MTASLQDEPTTNVASLQAENEFGNMLKRFRQGDSGLIPVVLGLVVLVIYFYVRNHVFFGAQNLTNLFIQSTIFILLGMAEIWLLLLGEIDLSLGYVLGIGGATAAIAD